jgi:tight adherence protein B
MAIAIVAILFLLTVGTLAAAFIVTRQGDAATQERLGQFVGGLDEAVDGDEEGKAKDQAPSALTQRLDEALTERGFGATIATDMARADLKLTIAEYFALIVISMVGVAALAWLIYGGFILPLVGLVAGFFIPRMYVKFRQGRRLKKFNDQLGDGITLMANGLRAGYSLLQAMDAVAREMPTPISQEFRRVVREIGLGVENERAFNNLLRRVPSDDLDLMVTAINVQQEVGGNLAEILEIIGYVIRERVRIKGEIKVLTAQAQISGYVISFLPIILGFILYAMNPEYIGRMIYSCEARGITDPEALCSQPCGWVLVGIGLFGIAIGFFAMQKITDIEV